MNPIEGRLQTGEHILARIMQNRFSGIKIVIARFFLDYGELEFLFNWDLRGLDLEELNERINEVILQNLDVEKEIFEREEVEGFNLTRIAPDMKEIRIVSIGDFDKRPCRDPHVDNTKQIGKFIVESITISGKDRYRFRFRVE